MFQTITVLPLTSSVRLDSFLVEQFPQTSRTFWKKHLSEIILVDNRKPKKGFFLKGGEIISVRENPDAFFVSLDSSMIQPVSQTKKILIHREDPDFLVVEKPAGIPTHPLSSTDEGTVMQQLSQEYPEVAKIGLDPREGGLIHRLDNDTSGLLLVARTEKAYHALRQQFKNRTVIKEYMALVEGNLTEEAPNYLKEGKVDIPIEHHPKNRKKMKLADPFDLSAREAITFFKLSEQFEFRTLLRIRILTGVRHQIRIHLAEIGYPIVGDSLYGKQDTVTDSLFLHASYLEFTHPQTDEKVTVHSPDLFKDRKDFLEPVQNLS